MSTNYSQGWESGAASGWTLDAGTPPGTIVVSNADPRTGTYHIRMTKTAGTGGPTATITLSGTEFRGRVVSVTAFARRAPSNSGDVVTYLKISDGGLNISEESWATVDVYTTKTLALTMTATATLFIISMYMGSGGAGVWDFDDVSIAVAPSLESAGYEAPFEKRETRFLQWPFGLRAYGSGSGKRAYPPLGLPHKFSRTLVEE